MNAALHRFRQSYAHAFEAYLRNPGENTLHRGYELGREAVTQHLSVMDLATVHHDRGEPRRIRNDSARVPRGA